MHRRTGKGCCIDRHITGSALSVLSYHGSFVKRRCSFLASPSLELMERDRKYFLDRSRHGFKPPALIRRCNALG